jgi:RNA polymerase sigma-70 factor, ECF subfamily
MGDPAAMYPPHEADGEPPRRGSGEDARMGDVPPESAPGRPSFRQIFEEHAAMVSRTLRYLGVFEADLTDAAQEVFLVVNRRYAEFEGRSTIATWLHAVCVRVAMNSRKKHRRRREDFVPEPLEASVDADQLASVERREDRRALICVLDMLDERQREIVVLHDIEKMPMRDVAEIVGCRVQTAYTRRNAALEKMRAELTRRSKFQ